MTVQHIGPTCWPRLLPWQDPVPPPSDASGPAMRRAEPGTCLARAQSAESALLLVIDGQLEMSSYRGRERLECGALALRPTFDCRAFRAGPGGAAWLHLPWKTEFSLGATYEVAEVDQLLLHASHDLPGMLARVETLSVRMRPVPPLRLHWVDDLQRAILDDPHLGIADWASIHRVSREGAARAFRSAYGVSPARFRLELRARSAWARIVSGDDPLSLIALETGFADQSHMTRAVGWLTGRPPSAWRRQYRSGRRISVA